RRCGRQVTEDATGRLREAGAGLAQVLAGASAGRVDVLTEHLAMALAAVRDAAGSCATEIRTSEDEDGPENLAAERAALAALDEVRTAADRMLGAFGPDIAARPEVVWLDVAPDGDPRYPATLRGAPLEVAGLLAERLFGRRTVTLTSATLSLGGSFGPLARQWGLPPADDGGSPAAEGTDPGPADGDLGPDLADPRALIWSGIDVGSPFDHPRSGILY